VEITGNFVVINEFSPPDGRSYEQRPLLIATDIGYCFDLYAVFDGSLDYRPFPNAQSNRIVRRCS
jgi:hypothetical protein